MLNSKPELARKAAPYLVKACEAQRLAEAAPTYRLHRGDDRGCEALNLFASA